MTTVFATTEREKRRQNNPQAPGLNISLRRQSCQSQDSVKNRMSTGSSSCYEGGNLSSLKMVKITDYFIISPRGDELSDESCTERGTRRVKLEALVYDVLALEESAGKRCSECDGEYQQQQRLGDREMEIRLLKSGPDDDQSHSSQTELQKKKKNPLCARIFTH